MKIYRYVTDIYKKIILTYKHVYRYIHTSNRYTIYVIKRQSRICKENVMFNVAANPQGISTIQNRISTNPTPAMEEDSTTGMAKICTNILNNDFK